MMKAAVLNRYLGTWGGGERVTYAIAHLLSLRGYSVDVLTDEPTVPTQAQITAAFGPGHDGFRIVRHESVEAIERALGKYSVFVNHCAGSSLVNPCPLGIYFVMFPFQDAGGFIQSYGHFICNSEFTRFYTKLKWGEHFATDVMYPGAAVGHPGARYQKDPIILSVGRFNTSGHTKNQALMVDAFIKMLPRLPPGWSLHLLGRVNDSPENKRYVLSLLERCEGLPIRFHFDVDDAEKRRLLERASLYWHATGFGRKEPQEAHAFEHFGISVVEAMGVGCVPLCYGAAGPLEIIEFGKSGWHFDTFEELSTLTELMAWQPARLEEMRRATQQRAHAFSEAAFAQRFNAFLDEVAP